MTDALMSQLLNGLAAAIMGGLTLLGGYVAWVLRKADTKLRDFADLPRLMIEATQALAKLDKRQDDLAAAMIDLKAEYIARGDLDVNEARPTFDRDGLLVQAGRTLCRWLGVGEQDLVRWGWTNFVSEADRDELRKRLSACLRDHVECSVKIHLVPVNDAPICIRFILVPVPNAPPARAWLGSMRKCKESHGQKAAA